MVYIITNGEAFPTEIKYLEIERVLTKQLTLKRAGNSCNKDNELLKFCSVTITDSNFP